MTVGLTLWTGDRASGPHGPFDHVDHGRRRINHRPKSVFTANAIWPTVGYLSQLGTKFRSEMLLFWG